MSVEETIVRICDRWWGELSHSKTASMRGVSEEWLQCLGWTPEDPVYLDGAACGYVVATGTGQRLVFYFVMPGELETPSNVLEKGLDYCETTLLLVGEAQLENYDYIVVTDLNRTYVYDASTDELLLSSDSPQLFVEEVLESLLRDEVVQGALDELRRDPASYVARQLRTWCERWCVALSREPYGTESVANAIMDRMLVLRFLYDHSICETPGWSFKGQFTHVISSSYEDAPATAKRNLVRLMSDMQSVWRCDWFAPDESVTRIISKSPNIIAMVQELALMAKTKFSVATILESFNYGDASEKARVRIVPEPSEEREVWLGKLGVTGFGESRLEVDILDEGYRAIPYWFDRVMRSLHRVSVEHELTRFAEGCMIETPVYGDSGEMDLFAWGSENEPTPSVGAGERIDLIALALSKLYYIWSATERQHRTAEIVLLLHVITLYESSGNPFGVFPKTDPAFGARSALLKADKERIYQSRAVPGEEWDVV